MWPCLYNEWVIQHPTCCLLHTQYQTCLLIPLGSQVLSFCIHFFNLDHCVVINMHWKVLCSCRSHGSRICCVFMYSICSGLFSCVRCISVHQPRRLVLTACLIYCKGKQAASVPRVILLEWGSQAALITSHVRVQNPWSGTCILWKPSVSWIFVVHFI